MRDANQITELAPAKAEVIEVRQSEVICPECRKTQAGQHASEKMGALREEIRQGAVVHCDETSSRVDGQSWWEWAFCTTQTVLHLIRFNRSSDVILM